MSVLRRVGVAMVVAGIAIGTLTGATERAPQRQADGTWILTADFHVHAFPGDGTLAPWDLRRHATRVGLDVIAITNHNQNIAAKLGTLLSRISRGAMVIEGEEVTSKHYHLIAIGTTAGINWNQSASGAIADVHAQGGVAIAAHPVREFWPGWDDQAISLLDGVEAAHPTMRNEEDGREIRAFTDRARRIRPGLAAIGSSDFHRLGPLGWCRTYVFATEPSASAVIDAVRQGRTVAEDTDGQLVGDAALIPRVMAYRAQAAASPPSSSWPRIGALCAWIGLLMILLFV